MPVSPQVAEVLGLPEGTDKLQPAELMRAILQAPTIAALAPCAIKAFTMPKQMPEPPPVTNATFPSNRSGENALLAMAPG